jgi:hypothetical protein
MELSITTPSVMAVSILDLIDTFCYNDTQHNHPQYKDNQHNETQRSDTQPTPLSIRHSA